MSDKWYISGPLAIGTPEPTGQLTLEGIVQPGQGRLTFFSNSADVEYDGGSDGIFVFRNTAANGETVFISDTSWLSLDTNADTRDSGILLKEGGTLKWWIWNNAREKQLCISRDGLSSSLTINESGNVGITKELTVGAGGNAVIKTRHIEGKHWQNDDADTLYLNWNSGKDVQIGESSRRSNLNVWGNVGIGTADTSKGKLVVDGGKILVYPSKLTTWPDGWENGIHTWDLYAEGTIGAGKDGTVNAYLNRDGDGYFKGNIETSKGYAPVVPGIANVKLRYGLHDPDTEYQRNIVFSTTIEHGETFSSKESYVVFAKVREKLPNLGRAVYTTYESRPADSTSFVVRWKFDWDKDTPLAAVIEYIVIGT